MRARNNKQHIVTWGIIFVLPGLISYLLFSFYPLISSLVQSFHYIRGAGNPWRFIFLENYQTILSSPDFWHSIGITFLYVLMTVPLGTFLAFIISISLTEIYHFRSFLRVLYFLPSVAGLVVIGIIFAWMYEPYNGLLNMVLDQLGLGPFLWLRGKDSALASIAAMTIWRTLGYNIVILMAGILSVPKTYYDAAEMDGVGVIRRHLNITLPLTIPTITFVVIYNSIQNLQVFAEVFVMTGGGPGFATTTIGFRIYREAFLYLSFGKAAANAVALMLIIVGITLIQMKLLNQRDYTLE
jgi:ABC-type sugar transport system permease subunit